MCLLIAWMVQVGHGGEKKILKASEGKLSLIGTGISIRPCCCW